MGERLAGLDELEEAKQRLRMAAPGEVSEQRALRVSSGVC